MTRLLIVLGVAAVAFSLAAPPIQACGDKFLVSSRPQSLGQMNTHAGVVLLYRNPQHPISRDVFDKDLENSLKKRGHTVHIVENPSELEKQIREGKVDLVVAVEEDARGLVNQATVMPVILGDSKRRIEVEKEFGSALPADTRTTKKVDRIDEKMKTVK